MPRYIVLIYADENAARTPEEGQAEMERYNAYGSMLEERGGMLGGDALHPTSTATTVRLRDGEVLTTDGPFVETKEALGGYYLIRADDLDTAIELAAQCPGAATGAVEVRPVMEFD